MLLRHLSPGLIGFVSRPISPPFLQASIPPDWGSE